MIIHFKFIIDLSRSFLAKTHLGDDQVGQLGKLFLRRVSELKSLSFESWCLRRCSRSVTKSEKYPDICFQTLTSNFFCNSNLPTIEQKNPLFRWPMGLWLALLSIDAIIDIFAICVTNQRIFGNSADLMNKLGTTASQNIHNQIESHISTSKLCDLTG